MSGTSLATATMGTGAGRVVYSSRSSGVSQNSLSVLHIKPGPSTALSVDASDFATVKVTLATNSSGVITSTAAQVVAAVTADSTAKFLVTAAVGQAGTAQAQAKTALSGGIGPYVSMTFNGYDQSGNFTLGRSGFNDIWSLTLSQHDLTGQSMPLGASAILTVSLDLTPILKLPFTTVA